MDVVATAGVVVRRAAAPDGAGVRAVMAAAFSSGPVAEWLVPEEGMRAGVYEQIAAAEYDNAVGSGALIDIAGECLGAAVWHVRRVGRPPGQDKTSEAGAGMDGAATTGAGGDADRQVTDAGAVDTAPAGGGTDPIGLRLRQLAGEIAARVPAVGHHHLAYLGVAPQYQCQGFGSALLAHHHHRLDTLGVGAFLVATSTRSRDLYLRHGYVVREEFGLPENGPVLWAMWRDAVPERAWLTN